MILSRTSGEPVQSGRGRSPCLPCVLTTYICVREQGRHGDLPLRKSWCRLLRLKLDAGTLDLGTHLLCANVLNLQSHYSIRCSSGSHPVHRADEREISYSAD